MMDQNLLDWIQNSQDDFAQRVREALAPTVQELLRSFEVAFDLHARTYERRHIMRVKIHRMVRD